MILCIVTKLLFMYFLCVRAQSCPTLCNPMDCCPPGSSIHGVLQARMLKWVVMQSSRGASRPKDWTRISLVCCTCRRVLCHCTTWEAPQSYRRPPSFGCPPFPTAFSVFIVLFLEQIHEPLTSPHPPRHMMAPEPWMQT